MARKTADNYFDVAELWGLALDRGGLRYRLNSYGKAVSLRQRCYRWRKRQLELTGERMGDIPGIPPSTPYDVYAISIRDDQDIGIAVGTKGTPVSRHFDLVFYTREAGGEIIEEEAEAAPMGSVID